MAETDQPSPTESTASPDLPGTSPRGWSGLERSKEETIAFAGTILALVLVVLSLMLGGLQGLLILFLILTVAMFGVMIVISLGN